MKTFIDAKRWIGLAIMLLGSLSITYGEKTTEQFIPIGYSPGISNKYSYIGPIVAVDSSEHAITVEDARGARTVKVTAATRIWLDRSKKTQTNIVGGFSDCQVGRLVEVMYLHDDKTVADWIKIET